jgi:hypothetical protein
MATKIAGSLMGKNRQKPFSTTIEAGYMGITRLTFDSNSLDRAVRPERFPKDPHQADYIKVRDALAVARLKGYFSESLSSFLWEDQREYGPRLEIPAQFTDDE